MQDSHGMTRGHRIHTLKGDIARAYIAILLGFFALLALMPAFVRNVVAIAAVQVGAPIVFIAILINHHSGSKSLSIVRSVGGSVGWLGFSLLSGEAFLWSYVLGGSTGVLIAFPLLIAGSVAFSIIVADRLWILWQRRSPESGLNE